MKINVLTSIGCSVCRGYCEKLRKSGFEVKEIDATSEEGRSYIKRYPIKGFPTLFIEVDELHNDILTGNFSPDVLAKKYLKI